MSERDAAGAIFAALFDLPARIAAVENQTTRILAALEALRRALPPPLVSVQEAAARLGVSVPTVRRLVKARRLPSVRVGGSVRIDLDRVHTANDDDVADLAARAREGRAANHRERKPFGAPADIVRPEVP